MIKTCIFDLDGTLLNTITTITYYVNLTLKDFDLPPITEEECKVFIGDGARALIERTLKSKGVSDRAFTNEALARYSEKYNSDPYYLTEIYEGVPELIERLKNDGVKLAVLSNKPHETTFQVIDRFFPNVFECVRGGSSNIPLKPEPDGALEILRELSSQAAECAFIGDTAVDILTAKNMGAALGVGVLWGFRGKEELILAGADAVVADKDELLLALGGAR